MATGIHRYLSTKKTLEIPAGTGFQYQLPCYRAHMQKNVALVSLLTRPLP